MAINLRWLEIEANSLLSKLWSRLVRTRVRLSDEIEKQGWFFR